MVRDVESIIVNPDRVGDPERRRRQALAKARGPRETPGDVALDRLDRQRSVDDQQLARVPGDRRGLEREDPCVLIAEAGQGHVPPRF